MKPTDEQEPVLSRSVAKRLAVQRESALVAEVAWLKAANGGWQKYHAALESERDAALAQVAALQADIQLVTAPMEAGGGIVPLLKARAESAESQVAALKAERDEALLSATFREDKHAEELGGKLMLAFTQVAALRSALARSLSLFDFIGGSYLSKTDGYPDSATDEALEGAEKTLAATEQAAREHDEHVRADEREACAKVAHMMLGNPSPGAWPFCDSGQSWNAACLRVVDAIRGRKP